LKREKERLVGDGDQALKDIPTIFLLHDLALYAEKKRSWDEIVLLNKAK
jgi:hypothetical protein